MQINLLKWPIIQFKEDSSVVTIGWIALVVNIVCSSTYNAFAKILTNSLSPLTMILVTEVLTGFFVLLSFGFVPAVKSFAQLKKNAFPPLLAIGVLCGIMGPSLLYVGLHRTTAINGVLFGNAEMVFMAFLSVPFLHEKFTRIHAFATLTVIAGMVMIALRGFTDGLTLQSGDVLVTVSCVCYAGGDIIFRKYLNHIDPNVVILTRCATGILGFFVLSPFMPHSLAQEVGSFPLQAIPVLLGFAFVSRFLNLFSFYETLERLPVATVSLALNIPVIGSIAFSAWFLGESMEPYHFMGGALIIGGVLMSELLAKQPSEEHLEKQLTTMYTRSPA